MNWQVKYALQYIQSFLEEASGAQARAVRALGRELEQAGPNLERMREILASLNEASERSYTFRRISMRGERAEPGEYRVTMRYGSETYVGRLMIRPDPLLEK